MFGCFLGYKTLRSCAASESIQSGGIIVHRKKLKQKKTETEAEQYKKKIKLIVVIGIRRCKSTDFVSLESATSWPSVSQPEHRTPVSNSAE